MAEKPQEQANPLPEKDELEAAELEKVSGGTGGGTNELVLEDTPGGQDTTASNVLKTRHDTVKNSINNVR
jgi:hypothetical protein